MSATKQSEAKQECKNSLDDTSKARPSKAKVRAFKMKQDTSTWVLDERFELDICFL